MPPVVIAGGIAAAGAIGGAVLSSSAQKKAANSAAAAQTQATDAQLQLGRETNALNTQVYNSNYATLSPFVSRGNSAGDQINALLGLPAGQVQQSPLAGGGANAGLNTGQWDAYLQANPDVLNDYNAHVSHNLFPTPEAYASWHYQHYGQGEGRQLPSAAPAQAQTPAANPQSATDAFNNFANSAGMQFQLKQGTNAIQNGAAAHGNLLSGATLKGLQNYGQQTALNNYFLPYLGLLGGQQATGAGAASSIAGVGQNFVNTAAGINQGMGNSIQNGANALSNAALIRGQANANMYNTIGSSLGNFASSFFPNPSGGVRY